MTDTAPASRKSRSGSRAPKNPRTKAQRLVRVEELSQRITARLAEVEELADERKRILGDLHALDGASFAEMARAAGTSRQAIHKSFHKPGKAPAG